MPSFEQAREELCPFDRTPNPESDSTATCRSANQALAAFDGKDYPPLIQRAMARAMSPTLDLTHAERVALCTLLARVESKDGESEFWVRRANFAELFGKVERTITNWLNGLEGKGWISKEQGRTRWGSFMCLTLNLTEAAAKYLGLHVQSCQQSAYARSSIRSRKNVAAGIKDQGLRQSLQSHPAGPLVAISGQANPALVETMAAASDRCPTGRSVSPTVLAKVPEDCRPLLELGLSPAAVFKLMAMAGAKGKRLSGIVKAKWKAIAQAKAPFGLLQKMCTDNVDYAFIDQRDSEQEATKQIEADQEAKLQAQRLATRQAYEGQWVRGKGNDLIQFVGGSAYLYRVQTETRQGDAFRLADLKQMGLLAGATLIKILDWVTQVKPAAVARPT